MVRTKLMTVVGWYAQDEVDQEDSEQNEVDGVKKGASWMTDFDWLIELP